MFQNLNLKFNFVVTKIGLYNLESRDSERLTACRLQLLVLLDCTKSLNTKSSSNFDFLLSVTIQDWTSTLSIMIQYVRIQIPCWRARRFRSDSSVEASRFLGSLYEGKFNEISNSHTCGLDKPLVRWQTHYVHLGLRYRHSHRRDLSKLCRLYSPLHSQLITDCYNGVLSCTVPISEGTITYSGMLWLHLRKPSPLISWLNDYIF